MKIIRLTSKNWTFYSKGLQGLEDFAEYPYGDDFFRINHGLSYFSFFERLGKPVFQLALDKEKIVGVGCGVQRELITSNGKIKAWYLCDLKIHPDYRSRRIPSKIFKKNLFRHYLICPRFYAISMNPLGRVNRVVGILKKFPYFPIKIVCDLNIYSFEAEMIKNHRKDLEDLLGPISFLTLEGKKDLIMKRSGQVLPLFHIQYGLRTESGIEDPQEGATHMIAAPANSKLAILLDTIQKPSATAVVLAHRMNQVDWGFIRSSDI